MKFTFAKIPYLPKILFFIALPCLSQYTPVDGKDLSNLSYDELYNVMVTDVDSTKFHEAYNAYIQKALKDKDTLKLAQALRLNSYNLNFVEAIENVDSSISIAQNIKKVSINDLKEFMTLAYYTKGAIYYSNDLNLIAVEEFIKSYELAKSTDNKKLLIINLLLIADIKAGYGQEDEAILLQRKTLEYLKRNKSSIEAYQSQYLLWTEQMIRSYLFSKELDSAAKYIDMGISIAIEENLNSQLRDFRIQQAKLNFYLKNYQAASDTLMKYFDKNDGLWLADDIYYLGMIAGEMGNNLEKKKHFLAIDSIVKTHNYPLRDNFNEVYQYLLKESIAANDASKTEEYLNRVVYYDSLLLNTQKQLREITLKKFDLPMQEEEKKLLGEMISAKSKWLTSFYVISGVMLLGLTAYYIKYTRAKKRLIYVMEHTIDLQMYKPITSTEDASDNKIDEEVASKVLDSLGEWERQKGFLDNTITQQILAKELNTNSTYLSQIINTYKNQNFASYLKDLRITHAINNLKKNPEIIQSKSMIHIAEMYGFNTTSVFSKAFKDKIGVTPGAFFRRIIEADKKETPKLG